MVADEKVYRKLFLPKLTFPQQVDFSICQVDFFWKVDFMMWWRYEQVYRNLFFPKLPLRVDGVGCRVKLFKGDMSPAG